MTPMSDTSSDSETGADSDEPKHTTARACYARDTRDTLTPSWIEETAIRIAEELRLRIDQLTGDFGTISRKIDTIVDNDHPNAKLSYAPTISVLQPKIIPGLSVVKRPDEWIQLEVTVDSGACVSVMPTNICEGIGILQNDLSRAGAQYEVANGATILNRGERKCEVMTVGSLHPKLITFQVADVHKPLLSISGVADMGYDCYLGKEGGSLRDRVTGETIPLDRQGSLYTVKMWVRQDPTVNISQPFVGQG